MSILKQVQIENIASDLATSEQVNRHMTIPHGEVADLLDMAEQFGARLLLKKVVPPHFGSP